MRLPRLPIAAAFASALVLAAPTVCARTEQLVGWPKRDVLHGTLRHLRVDLAYEVVEKDEEAGYVLFRFTPHGHKAAVTGSVEVIAAAEGRRSKLIVSLPKLPSYHELVLRDGLLKKLSTDYGEPAPEPEKDRDKRKAPERDRDKDRDKERDRDEGKGDGKGRDRSEDDKERGEGSRDTERRARGERRR